MTTLEWGPNEGEMAWADAVALAAERGEGWRLPTVQELVGQFDYAKGEPKDASWQRFAYWTGTLFQPLPTQAWFVSLHNGYTCDFAITGGFEVRLVREVQQQQQQSL